jgi:hypothetical protein
LQATGAIWTRLIYVTTVWWQRVGLATFRVEQVCLQRLACVSIAVFVIKDLTAALKELFGLSPVGTVHIQANVTTQVPLLSNRCLLAVALTWWQQQARALGYRLRSIGLWPHKSTDVGHAQIHNLLVELEPVFFFFQMSQNKMVLHLKWRYKEVWDGHV